MKIIKYFLEYIFISILFFIFKLIGFKSASNFGEKIGRTIGPLFRSKKKIFENLSRAGIGQDDKEKDEIIKKMWGNYGRILSEYPFLNKFKKNIYKNFIEIEGYQFLEEIAQNRKRVVFISGHFNNFELMAMQIENAGIELAAIYRPLNNVFLNKIMEKIRLNEICKYQIKKGKTGTRKLLELFHDGKSIALMIDQRVSEGLKVNFFGHLASTTTIPAQLVKKYKCEIVPIYIERFNNHYFKMFVNKPIKFDENKSIEDISENLNSLLEKMIIKNPDQWIWTHDRWK